MKPEITAQVTDAVLGEAAGRFAVDPTGLKPLDAFENYICEGIRGDRPCILRLTHESHRRPPQVEAELHWVNYLASHGLPVCVPIPSEAGRLVETLGADGARFTVAAFEKAPGQLVRRNDQTDAMTVNRGRLLGRMHRLTQQYAPPDDLLPRRQWYEVDDCAHFGLLMPETERIVIERFHELVGEIRSLEQTPETYGLIHTDAHTGNMFFDGDSPTLFDFDDCAYDYFTSDIAISLFYAVLFLPDPWDPAEYTANFLRHFLQGYTEEMTLDPRWPRIMPLILKRREIILYNAIHRGFDMDNLDDWSIRYLDGRRERIEKRIPYLEFDFAAFAQTL